METISEQEIEDYIRDYALASYRSEQGRERIVNALKTLSDEQLKQVYARIKGPNPQKALTEEDFLRRVKAGDGSIVGGTIYGTSLETVLDVFGEALGQEKVAGIVTTPIPPHPLSPDYRESNVYEPFANEIRQPEQELQIGLN
ncbi:MAG: hypothetical protein IJL43_02690 [Lachnospiraceae bacterium]|nr:hypothetical protein [Lachnospiraceae bacterium]